MWKSACLLFFFCHEVFNFFLRTVDNLFREFLSQNKQPTDRFHLCVLKMHGMEALNYDSECVIVAQCTVLLDCLSAEMCGDIQWWNKSLLCLRSIHLLMDMLDICQGWVFWFVSKLYLLVSFLLVL